MSSWWWLIRLGSGAEASRSGGQGVRISNGSSLESMEACGSVGGVTLIRNKHSSVEPGAASADQRRVPCFVLWTTDDAVFDEKIPVFEHELSAIKVLQALVRW